MTKPTVGFIGVGCLGRPMAERLLSLDFPLIAYNRTEWKAKALTAQGARPAESPLRCRSPEHRVLVTVDKGRLILMIGGEKDVLTKNRQVLEALGRRIVHTGAAGSAFFLKLVANQIYGYS